MQDRMREPSNVNVNHLYDIASANEKWKTIFAFVLEWKYSISNAF